MFTNINILKRLMKQAYKTGLKVARTEDRIYIAGNYWETDIITEYLPKQIHAQIIELAGELPDVGERYSANKDEVQMEAGLSMEVSEEGFTNTVDVTGLIILGAVPQRIIQDSPKRRLYIINEVFAEIADNSSVEEGIEFRVTRQAPFTDHRSGVLWKNNIQRFRAWFRSDEGHERLLTKLSMIDLTGDITGATEEQPEDE